MSTVRTLNGGAFLMGAFFRLRRSWRNHGTPEASVCGFCVWRCCPSKFWSENSPAYARPSSPCHLCSVHDRAGVRRPSPPSALSIRTAVIHVHPASHLTLLRLTLATYLRQDIHLLLSWPGLLDWCSRRDHLIGSSRFLLASHHVLSRVPYPADDMSNFAILLQRMESLPRQGARLVLATVHVLGCHSCRLWLPGGTSHGGTSHGEHHTLSGPVVIP